MAVEEKKSQNIGVDKSTSRNISDLASSIPTNLPALRGKFNGRDAEAQIIREWFSSDDVRLVTLTGFGGAGKTTLALHAAHAMLHQFFGGLFFIDLTPITTPALILPAIAKTIGVHEEPNRELGESLRDFLVNRSILFVLDNFEQVIEGAPIIASLLDANPHTRVLATSREALRLRFEHVLPIAPLGDEDAVQTFVQYAQTVNPQFRLTEDNTSAITELCKKLDGLPLAIELAAMRTRMFTPHALLARLTSDLEMDSPLLATLSSGPRDLPERQKTMRAAIAWSYSLLDEKEKRLLQVVSLFASGVAIQPLVSVADIREDEALESLASLVDKSLVVSISSNIPRFRLLEGIREFAREQAIASPEWNTWNGAFVCVFREVAQKAAHELEIGSMDRGVAQMELELANFYAAFDIAFASQDAALFSEGILLMEGIEQYWQPRQLLSEADQYVKRALKCLKDFDSLEPYIVGILYGVYGSLFWSRYNFDEALRLHTQAVRFFEDAKDEKRLGRALNNMVANLDEKGCDEETIPIYERALNLALKTGDVWSEIRVLANLGLHYQQIVGNEKLALENLMQAFVLAERHGKVFETTLIQFNIACLLYSQGDLTQADKFLQTSLGLAREHAFPQTEALSGGTMAMIAVEQKRLNIAAEYLLISMQKCRDVSALPVFYENLQTVAFLAWLRKQYQQAAIFIGGTENKVSNDHTYRTLPYPRGFENCVPALKSALGDQYEGFFQQGQRSSIDELHELARSVCEFANAKLQGQEAVTSIFTNRELDVLRLLARGRTNEEISKELVVVLKTVEKHVANVLRKLGVKNRTEAAAWAVENGIK